MAVFSSIQTTEEEEQKKAREKKNVSVNIKSKNFALKMLKNLPLIFGAEIRLEFAPLTELQNETFCHFQTKHCVWMMCICFFKSESWKRMNNSFGNVK